MRIEGQKKLGFYPTPDSVVAIIKTHLDFPASSFAVLDPCAGKGKALHDFLEGTSGLGYGVEINEAFIDECKTNLYRVARGGYESARITNGGFSVLFLNPPYDDNIGTEIEKQERKERIFLRNTVRYLKKDGILVYIIPQERLTEDIARMLVYRFREIKVFKFPSDQYQAFRQIVVMGILRDKGVQDKEEVERLVYFGEHPDETPVLEEATYPEYQVPFGGMIPLFRSGILDNAEVIEAMQRTGLRKKIKALTAGETKVLNARPVTKTHAGHDALLLAAGYGNGVLGTGVDAHLVRGTVARVEDTTVEEVTNEDGSTKEVTKVLQSHAVRIVLRKADGAVVTLM